MEIMKLCSDFSDKINLLCTLSKIFEMTVAYVVVRVCKQTVINKSEEGRGFAVR